MSFHCFRYNDFKRYTYTFIVYGVPYMEERVKKKKTLMQFLKNILKYKTNQLKIISTDSLAKSMITDAKLTVIHRIDAR